MAGEDAVNFVIGVFVSLGASFMDALGLNILKLDHVKEGNKSSTSRRGDCSRPLWHIGLYTYVASQLIGSTIALNYLKTQVVAPLGSMALIYNFIFAKILVGTNITRKDVFGTLVVVASVIWIVVFGGMYNGEDPESSISLENLKTLFTRPIFIIYFSALNIITLSGLALAIWSRWAMSNESKRPLFITMSPKKMRRLVGLMFAIDGGSLASETLLLAKSGVKLFTLSVNSQVNQFTDNTSRFIILALIITAILQVYCLNTALKLCTSVVVVPVFYGTYTALGLVNTIIYLDEIGNYPGWAISLVFAGIGVLIYGVFLLSSKPDPTSHSHDHDHVEDEDGEDQQHRHLQQQQQQQQEQEQHHLHHHHHHIHPARSSQQMVVILPRDQEMHAISSATSSTSPIVTTTTTAIPPLYSSDDNAFFKNANHDEKQPYVLPSTALTKTVTSISNTTAIYHHHQMQRQQPFASAVSVDETGHENHQGHHHRRSTSSNQPWFQRLLSRTPWRSIHRREDTFLSLHSTEASGSIIQPPSTSPSSSELASTAAIPQPSSVATAVATLSDFGPTSMSTSSSSSSTHIPSITTTVKTSIKGEQESASLTRRVHRTSKLSESSDPQIKDSPNTEYEKETE